MLASYLIINSNKVNLIAYYKILVIVMFSEICNLCSYDYIVKHVMLTI